MEKTQLIMDRRLAFILGALLSLNLFGCGETNLHTPNLENSPTLELPAPDEEPFAHRDSSGESHKRVDEDFSRPARIGIDKQEV